MSDSLETQRIVIIGARYGIGLATAKRLSAAGAELVLAGRDLEALRKVANDLPGPISAHRLDVTVERDVEAFFDAIGTFDHLVVTAAGAALGTLAEAPTEETRALIESKFWGQAFAVKYGARRISNSGSITLFSGTVTEKPLPGTSAYAAVGSAIEAAGRIWALELAPVRINTIVPGVIDTPVWAALVGEDGAAAQLAQTASLLPVGRVGTADDVAKTVAFVIDNGFVNGASIVVDGGHRLI